MQLFFNEQLNDINFHDKYKLLNNLVVLNNERNIIQQWADGFIDRDGKILDDFQREFHSTLWEFYIHQLLKNMGAKIDFSKHRPDFIVKNDDGTDRFYIEARISGIKENGRPESDRKLEDLFETETPVWKLPDFHTYIKEGIIRCSNGFLEKAITKYEKYKKDNWFSTEVPYIIGLSSFSQVNYGLESYYSILALLYGQYIQNGGHTFGKCPKILKENKEKKLVPIQTNLFNDKKFSHVSAVLFSSKLTLGKLTALSVSSGTPSFNLVMNVYQDMYNKRFIIKEINQNNPEMFSDGLFLFHNPNAKQPLDPSVFKGQGIIQVFQKKKKLVFSNTAKPLVCRLNRAGMRSMSQIQKMSLDELYNT
ncbi:hypothetical protein ACLDYB_09520 [Acinetobacter baumannii]